MRLRLSELKLPLNHADGDLLQLAARVLGVAPEAVAHLDVFKRSFDARKSELMVVTIADVQLRDPVAGVVDEVVVVAELDRGRRARLGARRGLVVDEPVVAQGALLGDTALGHRGLLALLLPLAIGRRRRAVAAASPVVLVVDDGHTKTFSEVR